jgi:hypothetical protein
MTYLQGKCSDMQTRGRGSCEYNVGRMLACSQQTPCLGGDTQLRADARDALHGAAQVEIEGKT